ncbi:MAG: citrate transporter [Lachnospiraceae bacterium]|nr:citrate transporter [Lachnospiraceae bacterium]
MIKFIKKDPMLPVALAAAVISLFITPPDRTLLSKIDWHTLGTLFMMLTVLEGFKQEDLFLPLIRLSSRFKSMVSLSFFLIFGVFFTSMFVTNDVSLIIFVPLTIMLFRGAGREECILPVISMENIAAIRGSLLMPFGSPQNLYLYEQSGTDALNFMLHMSPLCISSAALLSVFILIMYRREKGKKISLDPSLLNKEWKAEYKKRRIAYIALFLMILAVIVSRTGYWPAAVAIVMITVSAVNIKLFRAVDYVLLLTFLCFFIFSSSVSSNQVIGGFLNDHVRGNEYFWAIGLSQIISNVPASIVLYPFTDNFAGLIYGLDTAGLCSLIGSLASVINYRIYVRSYPKKGKDFIKVFTLISWAFFVIVVIPGFFLSRWRFF